MRKILILLSISIFIIGLTSCFGGNNDSVNYSNSTVESYQKINVAYEVLGEIERNIPEVSNEGLSAYPVYGKQNNSLDKPAILAENRILNAGNTYDSMDAEGNLYLNGEKVDQEFYKHTYADSNYYGTLSDEDPAVIKKISFNNIVYKDNNMYTTGLYAPAGEVIKIEIAAEDLDALGGSYEIYMGQVTNRGNSNNIRDTHGYIRMPEHTNKMIIKSSTAYVGTYFGGPIYINKLKDIGHEFSITISGAVEYAHYILGSTTEEDYNRFIDSTAPFYELNVYDMLRFTGPAKYSFDDDGTRYTFDEITRMAEYWYNVAVTSEKVPGSSSRAWGIDTLFDCYVYGNLLGGGVALKGANFCTNDVSWMRGALDYDSFMQEGNWGNMHEFNHHYQEFGVGDGGEVTNNAVTLLEYAMYTNISANRTADTQLSGWNRYTDPTVGLKEVLNAMPSGNPYKNLGLYSVLIHSLTPQQFLNATSGNGVDNYFKNVSNSAKLDMTYYFTKVLNLNVSQAALDEIKSKNYSMFVPAAISYQTGRGFKQEDGSILYNHSAQPYKIAVEKNFKIDFNKYLYLPSGFNFKVVSIEYENSEYKNPINKISENVYEYVPNSNLATSGAINVRISINNSNLDFVCDDIYLQLEFDHNNPALTITNYRYTDDTMYENVALAYANNFAGYESKDVSNTTTGIAGTNKNTVSVFEGKVYIDSTAKYRIAIKANTKSMLYISLDGKNYHSAGYVNKTINSFNNNNNKETYTDYELNSGNYIYFKVIMAGYADGAWVEVGMGKFNGDNVSINSINTKYLMNLNLAYNNEIFDSKIAYKLNYLSKVQKIDLSNATIVDATNADVQGLNNLIDSDLNTSYTAPVENVSEETPVIFTIDLGNIELIQSFTFKYCLQWATWYCYYAPINYKVYAGTSLDNMQLIGDYKNQINNSTWDTEKTININPMPIRYIKFEITSTQQEYYGNNRKFALKEIIFNDGYNMLSIDDNSVFYSNNDWKMKNDQLSTYGHYFESNNGKIYLDFEGTVFILNAFVGTKYGKIYISIDGKEEILVELNSNDTALKRVFTSKVLTKGKHRVTIRGEGLVNVESFGYVN